MYKKVKNLGKLKTHPISNDRSGLVGVWLLYTLIPLNEINMALTDFKYNQYITISVMFTQCIVYIHTCIERHDKWKSTDHPVIN